MTNRRPPTGSILGFLMAVKQMIESPDKMVFGNKEPGEVLLGL